MGPAYILQEQNSKTYYLWSEVLEADMHIDMHDMYHVQFPSPCCFGPLYSYAANGNGGGAGPSTLVNRVLPRSGGRWWWSVSLQLGWWIWNRNGICFKFTLSSDWQLWRHRWWPFYGFCILHPAPSLGTNLIQIKRADAKMHPASSRL